MEHRRVRRVVVMQRRCLARCGIGGVAHPARISIRSCASGAVFGSDSPAANRSCPHVSPGGRREAKLVKLFSSSSTPPVVPAKLLTGVDGFVRTWRPGVPGSRSRPGSVRSNGRARSTPCASDGAQALVERRLDVSLQCVDDLADGLARLRLHASHLLQDRRKLPLLAEDSRVFVAQRLLGRRRIEPSAIRRAQHGKRELDSRRNRRRLGRAHRDGSGSHTGGR